MALGGIMLLSCGTTDDYLVVIETPYGTMKALLYDETPLHKENFLKLARKGQYDSTIFHRVIQNFMVQGGDVNMVEGRNVDYTIPAELDTEFIHKKGALAAARMGDDVNPERESSGCQFYIVQGTVYTEEQLTVDQYKLNMAMRDFLELPEYATLRDSIVALQTVGDMASVQAIAMACKDTLVARLQVDVSRKISPAQLEAYTTVGGSPHLDGAYTVFGRVVEGIEVVDKIAAQPTGKANKPTEDIHMIVSLEKVKKADITEKYGYTYPIK